MRACEVASDTERSGKEREGEREEEREGQGEGDRQEWEGSIGERGGEREPRAALTFLAVGETVIVLTLPRHAY